MASSPRQPKRSYLDTVHRVMRGIGAVGKEVTRGGPSPKEQMSKKYGKYYQGFQGKLWMRGKKGEGLVGVAKYLSKSERQLAALKIRNRSRGPHFQPGRFGLRQEDVLQKAYPQWVEVLGKQKADMLLNSQDLHSSYSQYSGGREVRVEKGEEMLMRTAGLSKEDKYLAREIYRGAAPVSFKETTSHRREFTQEENVEIAEEIGKEFGAQAKDRYEKSWGVERLGGSGAKSAPPAPRSRWNISSLTGWGRRPSGGDAGSGANTNIKKT